MAFDPDAFLAAADTGFDPDAFLGATPGVEARIKELGGIKQPDGSYLVPGADGTAPFRLDASGNRLDEAPAIGGESTKEAILNRVVATGASGAQGFIPQIAGAARAVNTLGTGQDAGDAYRETRDETKRTIEMAKEKAGLGYEILGQLPSAFVAPASVAGRVGLSALMAGAQAAAGSDVDLTRDDADLGKFAKDVGTGAAIGTAAAGLGEGLGYGISKLGGLVSGNAAKAIATQTAKDAALVEKEVASLAGKVGAETQKGSRLIENLQRGTEGIPDIAGAKELAEGVLASNRATLPGQLATIEAAKLAHATAAAAAPGRAAELTREYFAAPLFQSEILPRLKSTIAPRFGLAAAGMVMGGGFDLITGGDGKSGSFAGAVLGAPGMMQMLRNVAKSPRVQVAVATKLAPLLQNVANTMARGIAPAASMFSQYVITEAALGPPNLAAEQLVAQGGLKSLLGKNGAQSPEEMELNAARTPLDRAIAQTVGVTMLGGSLEEHHDKLDSALSRVFKGNSVAGAKEHAVPDDLSHLAANPEAMLERLANNTGNLSAVAPMVAAELAAVAQRATSYLAKVSEQPPRRGPLAPEWTASAAEKRSLRLATGVVANPMSVLDAAAAGTIVPEQVAALNAVYPMLGRSIADKAVSMLEAGKAVPYRARLMVGFLAGIDVDGTLASIASNQMAIQSQSQKPSNQAPPPSDSATQLTVAQRSAPRKEKEAS